MNLPSTSCSLATYYKDAPSLFNQASVALLDIQPNPHTQTLRSCWQCLLQLSLDPTFFQVERSWLPAGDMCRHLTLKRDTGRLRNVEAWIQDGRLHPIQSSSKPPGSRNQSSYDQKWRNLQICFSPVQILFLEPLKLYSWVSWTCSQYFLPWQGTALNTINNVREEKARWLIGAMCHLAWFALSDIRGNPFWSFQRILTVWNPCWVFSPTGE